MEKFTVISVDKESGQIFSDHVLAKNGQHAFYVAAQDREDVNFISSLSGHVNEGEEISFVGECCVDTETVLEQTDVFNGSDFNETEENLTSTVLANFEIQDWHITELGKDWTGPKSHKDTYRFVIEQSPNTQQVYFKLYPTSLDKSYNDLAQNGLSGMIEVRNGKPAISLGLEECSLPIHIESDVTNGLYLHTDDINKTVKPYFSFDHGMNFDAVYYSCGDNAWLREARSTIADHLFENHNFGKSIVSETGGWNIDDDTWSLTVYFENESEEGSTKGHYEVGFCSDSTVVDYVSTEIKEVA
ncbi:hypothetical protein A3715_15925 [Oleiphilus sp. HI0009]|nr:hypothetical protein A3715_15925 [Oleiphilus sp. HI0009]